MKNKKAIYILLPAVALIWGIVFYRIFTGVKSDETLPQQVVSSIVEDVEIGVDTFSIVNNYRDPFLNRYQSSPILTSVNTQSAVVKKELVTPKKVVMPEVVRWPSLYYRGIVKNNKSNKQVVLMSIDGTGYLMKQGEQINGVVVSQVYRDSVVVQYLKDKKVIKK